MFSYNKVKLIKNQSPPEKLLGLFLFKSFVINKTVSHKDLTVVSWFK